MIEPKPNHEYVKSQRKKWLFVILPLFVLLIAGGAGAYFYLSGNTPSSVIDQVKNKTTFGESGAEGEAEKVFYSPISGLPTTEAKSKRRAVAVMLGSDPVARPLSGLSTADFVVEMPATPSEITRIMGVWQLDDPKEIGGVRSARHDFIPLAAGLNAVFVHWGGSVFALDQLKGNIIDHFDALKNGSVFYRVSRKSAPFNGYTSAERIRSAMEKSGMSATTNFKGYNFIEDAPVADLPTGGTLTIPYPGQYQVSYKYRQKDNSYIRYHAGVQQKDEINGKELVAKNVIVMFAPWVHLKKSYLDVDVEEGGKCLVFHNGEQVSCTWKKGKPRENKLTFYDAAGKEIPLVRGATWVSVVQPSYKITWKPETKATTED